MIQFKFFWLAILLPAALSISAQSIYYYDPAISPDRSEIAFVSGGDIWTASANGGDARLLISHPSNELRPFYSPDGRQLAFISNRTGNGDIYLFTFSDGSLKRITFDDANDQLDGWSPDGKWLYFSSTSKDIAGTNDIYRVSPAGGTPMQVAADRYMNEFFAAPSPDGKSIAFTARGFGQWWRKGSSNMDTSEIWLWNEGAYKRVTEDGARETWAMWGDAKSLFYISDRGGSQNIWNKKLDGRALQVTNFKDGRVLWPNVSYDGKTIVFERDFKIWKIDTDSKKAAAIPINLRGSSAAPGITKESGPIQEMALSPDGKKVAFIARGEIFAASAADGGDAFRVTNNLGSESDVAWSPDSKKIVYSSSRNGSDSIFSYDFSANTESQITSSTGTDFLPRYSPDGKKIAYLRDRSELRIYDTADKSDKAIAKGLFDMPPFNGERQYVWSPDSRWIAFFSTIQKQFSNLNIVNIESGKIEQASFLANVNNGTVSWSPDGTFLQYVSSQRTETSQVARIDLLPRSPQFREDQFRDLFNEPNQKTRPATPAPPATPSPGPATSPSPAEPPKVDAKPDAKKTEIDFENIRRRLSFITTGVDVFSEAISPNGKYALYVASSANQVNLYIYPLEELTKDPLVAKQITTTPGFKSNAQFTPDSKEVAYLEGGRINFVNIDNRQVRGLSVNAEMEVDFSKEKNEVFNQAWRLMRDNFYDPGFHGADWNKVKETYEPMIAGAQNADVMRRLLNLMVGELNASHLGAGGPQGGAPPIQAGKLGLRFERATYESSGKLKITEIIELSPAAISKEIKTGQILTAIDGKTLDAKSNLDELLAGKAGKKISLTLTDDGGAKKEVSLKPISTGAEKNLLYRQWVEANRAYVAKASNGKLGYVHIPDMSQNSLQQLYNDLDADNYGREAIVIDIRNNNGGFVNVYAIDVFARKGYLNFTPRGFPTSNGRTNLGQRSLEKPTILITNRHTLSDGEDFTEGYRSLKLGKVVGEPTAAWIIFTSNISLIDGTSFRIPFIKITTNEGADMELSPRPVDIPVKRAIGESYENKDSQLDAAIRELLNQIGR